MIEISGDRWIEVSTIGEGDKHFDVNFWQAQGPEAIFAAAWELVVLAHQIKGGSPDELELQRSVVSIQTSSPTRAREG